MVRLLSPFPAAPARRKDGFDEGEGVGVQVEKQFLLVRRLLWGIVGRTLQMFCMDGLFLSSPFARRQRLEWDIGIDKRLALKSPIEIRRRALGQMPAELLVLVAWSL
jgi:hypothetical protein